MRKCESCGKTYSESRDIFCPHCGAVAHKKCSHSFSTHEDNNYYDRSRFDRGGDYSFNKSDAEKRYNQEKKYEKNSYGEKTDRDEHSKNQNNNTQPLKTLMPKKPVNRNKKASKGIGIFIAIVVLFNVIVGVFEELDTENLFDDAASYIENGIEDVYCSYIEANGIEFIKPDDTQYKMIISIDKLGFDYDAYGETVKDLTDFMQNESTYCCITAYEREKIEFDGKEDFVYESADSYWEEELYFGELIFYGDLGYVFAFEKFPELSKGTMTHIYGMTIGDVDEENHESYDDYEMYYGSQYCVDVGICLDAVSLDNDGNVKYYCYSEDAEIDGEEYQQYENTDTYFEFSDYYAQIDMKTLDIAVSSPTDDMSVVSEENEENDV
ncbi:MAG: hypothetical protein KIG53_06715 [Oscillospiraceae bacterium]|nr:hypothetical protein [Oscillospiraceae bacterium]